MVCQILDENTELLQCLDCNNNLHTFLISLHNQSSLDNGDRNSCLGNSTDKIRHPRPVAYSAEQVLLNRQQIWGGGACMHCYRCLFVPSPCKNPKNVSWRRLSSKKDFFFEEKRFYSAKNNTLLFISLW